MNTQKESEKINGEGSMMPHAPVLLHETIELLRLHEGSIAVDGTVGAGGHAEEIAKHIGSGGTLICLDQDDDALQLASLRLSTCAARTHFLNANFRTIAAALDLFSLSSADAILLDLGISSMHITDSGRGFSFERDEPLQMTMQKPAPTGAITAADIVNGMTEKDLADIIFRYGEERLSRRIARAIVLARSKRKITTSKELSDSILSAVPRRGRRHPATKTFQALRIVVNDELNALKDGLAASVSRLSAGGRIAIISFHSMEDRIVKNMFRDFAKSGVVRIITKKPIVPSRLEIKENPRSRSAKLRVAEKM